MKRFGLAAGVILVIAAAIFTYTFANETPQVPVHKTAKGTFEDQVTTNGRVEPIDWASARAEREGLVLSVPVTKGQRVAKGSPLAILDSREAQAELASATARIDEANAAIQLLESGGRKREIVEIEQSIRQRQTERAQIEKELAVAERLLARNAGTREEVRLLRDKLELTQLQIQALDARRPTLVASADLVAAKARLKEAQASADNARRRIELSTVRSPMDGVVYQLDVRQGVYLSPGALVANVGRIDSLKVLVFVDEPELGRIRKSMPVSITWDALEGKRWTGTIEKIPTQIVPLGTRHVGEVECRIENTENDLLPGTNVNAFIQTRKLDSVLLAPKEAIRSQQGTTGVYVVENDILVWKKIETGPSNVTNAVVLSGLNAGDLIALGPDTQLKPGARVKATLQ